MVAFVDQSGFWTVIAIRRKSGLVASLLEAALYGIFVLWLAATLVFIALRLLPGNGLAEAYSQRSQESTEFWRQELGLDDPLPQQYVRYLGELLQGDFGKSISTQESVMARIGVRLGPTIALGLAAFGIALLLGSLLGLGSSIESPRWIRQSSDFLVLVSQAVPFYITALLAIYLFSLKLDLLPAYSSNSPLSLVLPAATLGFHSAGSVGRVLSLNLRETYRQNFMLTARAKGLPPIDLLDHALRVALLPTLGVLALQAGFVLSGTIVIEVMFVRRGLGTLLFQSVQSRDYPVVQAIVLLGTLVYMLANGLSTLCRTMLDPRLVDAGR